MEQESEAAECCSEDWVDHKMMVMWHMAKQAKWELLKERIKKRVELKEGQKLDKIADAFIDSMGSYSKMQDDMETKRQEARERIQELFEED